ncbi:GDSL-like Lipase/Acylhydrolase family protein [Actinacidiphila yanglinensis]|uniref:GDSL-like Lipase/Acylhydrolase family protein n=1 Tax=Actinacidiphila yanglinensis TaxID=310779 RepID=A0A1H6EAP0_9ACTN|nr:SGNH/GDSL hydrolase family protein [Actinacidiphila yanglinensis]SEG94179.1 GDSL-like Lipase/Acylhydrolase family protein [Actinacidiphila yanglinensis]
MPRFLSSFAVAGTAAALLAALLAPGAAQAAAPASGRAADLSWVALGDSYTAGVIQATGDTYENPPDGCARTIESYPEVIRRDLGSLVSLRDVSCGAATVKDVYETKQTPLGRPLPPSGTDPDAPFTPVAPQIDAVAPDTDLITVGAGGNTVGFGEILIRCLALGAEHGNQGTPCKDELDASLSGRLDQLRKDYGQMLDALHTKAPFARMVTVGYPHVIPEDATSCTYGDLRQFGTITTGDLAWARTHILEPLNAAIAQESVAHNATFVDLYPSTTNHSVCDSNHWVDGIFSSLIPLRYAYVHPNAKGQANTASQVEDAILGG